MTPSHRYNIVGYPGAGMAFRNLSKGSSKGIPQTSKSPEILQLRDEGTLVEVSSHMTKILRVCVISHKFLKLKLF